VYANVFARGSRSLVLTSKGAVYYNPTSSLEILNLPHRPHIQTAALGINYGALLSNNGILYLIGKAPSPEPF